MSETTLNLAALEGFELTWDEVGVVNSGARDQQFSPVQGADGNWTITPNSIVQAPESSVFGNSTDGVSAAHPQPSKATVGSSFQFHVTSHFASSGLNAIVWNIDLKLNDGHNWPQASNAFIVLGWNANSILLESAFIHNGGQTFFEISDGSINTSAPQMFGHDTADLPTFASGAITLAVVCFAAGTRIATPDGAVAVEDLAEGDLVRTVSGAVQPVRWVGRRHFDCSRHPQPAQVMPVAIAADAFGPGLPASTLTLSPEHAVFVDGVLVPVRSLVNGTTIRQALAEAITYYHIELPRHDVVLAEGLPAETYLDTGNRQALIRRETSVAQAA